MVDGLAQVHGQPGLAAVVNTGDDGDFYGLRVCPDLDICTCLEGLATYGREAWFGLGDRDLATHIHRILRLAEGAGLAQVAAEVSDQPARLRAPEGAAADHGPCPR